MCFICVDERIFQTGILSEEKSDSKERKKTKEEIKDKEEKQSGTQQVKWQPKLKGKKGVGQDWQVETKSGERERDRLEN